MLRLSRAAVERARAELEKARAELIAAQERRDLALAEAERWRLECGQASRERDFSAKRRTALFDSLEPALGSALWEARKAAWDDGWAAAGAGWRRAQNPYRSSGALVTQG